MNYIHKPSSLQNFEAYDGNYVKFLLGAGCGHICGADCDHPCDMWHTIIKLLPSSSKALKIWQS